MSWPVDLTAIFSIQVGLENSWTRWEGRGRPFERGCGIVDAAERRKRELRETRAGRGWKYIVRASNVSIELRLTKFGGEKTV